MTTKNNPLACMRFARSSTRRLLPGLLLALGLGGCVEVIGIEDTEIEPGRSYTTEAQHGKAHYTSSLRVEPTGEDACVLSMHFDAEVEGMLNKTLGAVMGKIFEGSTRKLMQQDLADIAEAAEAGTLNSG